MVRAFLFASVLFLAGCFGGNEIEDYSSRSVVYGWMDVSEIRGNHLYNMTMRQYSPVTRDPYYSMGIKKFAGGYLFWHYGFHSANYEFDKLFLQSCLAVICSNTINEYAFGSFGDAPGKTQIRQPGVTYVGAYKMRTTRRGGMFTSGQFDIVKTGGPSRSAMLQELLKGAPPEHPEVAARIRAAMR